MYSEHKVHLFIYDSNVSLGDDDLTSSGFDRFGSGENQLHLKVCQTRTSGLPRSLFKTVLRQWVRDRQFEGLARLTMSLQQSAIPTFLSFSAWLADFCR